MKIVTATICLSLPDISYNSFPISTLTIGCYALDHFKDMKMETNYARQRDTGGKRIFYDIVKFRTKNLTFLVFPTGKIQVLGLKNMDNHVREARKILCDLFNSWKGSVAEANISKDDEHGFHLHAHDIIYGYPYWPGCQNPFNLNYTSDTLVPIGLYFKQTQTVYMHGTQMKILESGFFTSIYVRRERKYRKKLLFDAQGRVFNGDLHPTYDKYQYKYNCIPKIINPDTWIQNTVLINGFFKMPTLNQYDLFELARYLRSKGFFTSYDTKICKNINIKFRHESTKSVYGTVLVSKKGYFRLCGFKLVDEMEMVQMTIEKAIRQFVQFQ